MNMHPKLKELFELQAKGATLLEAFSPSAYEAVAVFQTERGTRRLRVKKADLSKRFEDAPTVTAAEGESYQAVIQRLSEKYNLLLVPDVDYDTQQRPMLFSEELDKNTLWVFLTISDVALGWFGSVKIKVVNRDTIRTPAEVAVAEIEGMRLSLALASRVFKNEEAIFTPERDALSLNFVQEVCAYLKTCGVNSLTPNALGTAQLVGVIADAISGIIVVKPKEGRSLFIRYETKHPETN